MSTMMKRTYWPIGHGGFITEQFEEDSLPLFTTVYDCGSTVADVINQRIDEFTAALEVRPVDFLFLSHFHKDHINGVTHLLKRTTVRALVVPEFNEDTLLYEYIKIGLNNPSSDNGGLAAMKFLAAMLGQNPDPEVELPRIITIIPSGDNNDILFRNANDIPENVPSGTRLIYLDIWEYLPFNLPFQTNLSSEVVAAVKTRFCPNQPLSIRQINELLANKKSFSEIQAIYKKHGRENHHSMIVYSGRAGARTKSIDNALHMGDFEATRNNLGLIGVRNRLNLVGIIQVPHHGSIHNYDANAQLYEQGVVAISFASEGSSGHPATAIVQDIRSHGGISIKVSNADYTQQEFYITPRPRIEFCLIP